MGAKKKHQPTPDGDFAHVVMPTKAGALRRLAKALGVPDNPKNLSVLRKKVAAALARRKEAS